MLNCKPVMDSSCYVSEHWSFPSDPVVKHLSFRTNLAGKSFSLSSGETSPATIVTDTIRKIDFEAARYQKLIATLPSSIDVTGL